MPFIQRRTFLVGSHIAIWRGRGPGASEKYDRRVHVTQCVTTSHWLDAATGRQAINRQKKILLASARRVAEYRHANGVQTVVEVQKFTDTHRHNLHNKRDYLDRMSRLTLFERYQAIDNVFLGNAHSMDRSRHRGVGLPRRIDRVGRTC